MSKPLRYSLISIVMHWLIAVLIVAAFSLGSVMTDMKISPDKLRYYSWHKWLGVTILALVALRLLARLVNSAPAYPEATPQWQKTAASLTHGVLYILMFTIPLSGYFYTAAAGYPVVYLGLIQLPMFIAPDPELKIILKQTHEILTTVLLGAAALHVAAALKHQFIDKDHLLRRMLPGRR